MKAKQKPLSSIDDYLESFPQELRIKLKALRSTIQKAAPKAEQSISYNIPAFKLHGPLVYFAVFKNHIGFFPTASGVKTFSNDLKKYKTSKGTIQFPHDEEIPLKLVAKIVKFRVKENLEKAKKKKKGPKIFSK